MSQEHVVRHRLLNAAFNERDTDGLVALCHPEIEIHSVFAAVGGAIYRGHDGVRRWWSDITEAWTDFHIDDEAYFDLPRQTLAFVVLTGRGSVSGAEVVMPYAQVMHWRDGLCIWFKAYARREDALADLGISERDLNPS